LLKHDPVGRQPNAAGQSELALALDAGRRVLVAILGFSGLMSLLTLTAPLFMLQVYDRVVPSRSLPTLVGLCLIALLMFVSFGFLDQVRARVLIRIGLYFEEQVHRKIFNVISDAPLARVGSGDGLEPLRDLDQIRSFMVGGGPAAFCDLPFLPLQVAICFLVHPLIGWLTVLGAIVIFGLALATELMVGKLSQCVSELAGERLAAIESARRNAEIVRALGMGERLAQRWAVINGAYEAARLRVQDRAVGFSGLSRVFRMTFQSGVLGLGAFLVIRDQATFGVIIAASILSARALLPVEQLVANWRGVVAVRQSWRRLAPVLGQASANVPRMALPPPTESLSVEGITVIPPGAERPAVANVGFDLPAGAALGVIGPNGAGKSSLVRALVGAWSPVKGHVRLDGADLEQWEREALGRHVGYLPQDGELFAGTVAQNIARFDPDAAASAIVAAARAAGVHDTILKLPGGYATEIGEGGAALSAGHRQRIALARALYGDPFLVVLDEPNSNLDAEGEAALIRAMAAVRQRRGIVVVVAHRPSVLDGVDYVLALVNGTVFGFGPKEDVFRRVLVQRSTAVAGTELGAPGQGAAP
jgi:PrtD family type I secretion system ABC transporter